MAKKIKVAITKYSIVEMTENEFEELRDACFKDDDRQMVNELVDLDCDGYLTIEKVQEV